MVYSTDRSKAVVSVFSLTFIYSLMICGSFYKAICFIVLSIALCYFVVFFSPFCVAITSLGEERGNLSAFRPFVRFALVWLCLFPLRLGVWEGLRLVIVALSGLFSYFLFCFM